ncbi:hypothetical protein PSCICO_02700 [Pseudomonas cichorii]|nr:hypothetical protein PSCICO_02700 [Pseudomonas cichorii]
MSTYFLSGEVAVEFVFKPIETLPYKGNSESFFIKLVFSQAAWLLFHELNFKAEPSTPIKVISAEWQIAEIGVSERALNKNRISVILFVALSFSTVSPIAQG